MLTSQEYKLMSAINTWPARIVLLAFLAAPTFAFATNGYQLVCVCRYQKSLGGAVTAKPGSAMTAITNPAGMARIGNRTDFSMEAFMPDRSADFGAFGGGMYGTSGLGVDYADTH
jgi:long-chain fatty acid transport protein